MKAIVTGGAGFIGSHMVDLLLNEGHRVIVIDNMVGGRESNLSAHASNSRLDLERCDIRQLKPDAKLFEAVDHIYHFAGIGDIVPSIENPIDYMSVNVQGSVHLLECARHCQVRKFVYAASSSCYGIAKTPTDESHPIRPEYPYALSKYMGEQAAFHWHKVYKLPVNSIRIFNAYGTRARTSGAYGAVFGVFLKQKIAGTPFTVVGDGSQTRDFVYATDVARAFFAAGESSLTGQIWNVGAGSPQSVKKIVQLIGGDVVHIPKRPGEPDCTWANISKIQSELGWNPTVSIEDGVKLMLNDIDHWKDAPLWDAASIEQASRAWFEHLK